MILYTDHSPESCNWLRSLVENKALPPGEILETDINEITPNQLSKFSQCHFFCGIGGWPLACEMAGIPQNFHIWTASLPCQPFSNAGHQKGFKDDRHLWPVFFKLVKQCSPPIIIGEQVLSAPALEWWDKVASDLEGISYSVGAIALPAAAVGAYHRRDRLYWGAVAHAHLANPTSQRDQWSGGFSRTKEDPRFGIWDNPAWVGSYPIEPGICPVVNGVPRSLGRPAKLRGYGNAIVPQLGAVFLQEFLGMIYDNQTTSA